MTINVQKNVTKEPCKTLNQGSSDQLVSQIFEPSQSSAAWTSGWSLQPFSPPREEHWSVIPYLEHHFRQVVCPWGAYHSQNLRYKEYIAHTAGIPHFDSVHCFGECIHGIVDKTFKGHPKDRQFNVHFFIKNEVKRLKLDWLFKPYLTMTENGTSFAYASWACQTVTAAGASITIDTLILNRNYEIKIFVCVVKLKNISRYTNRYIGHNYLGKYLNQTRNSDR